MTFTRLRLATAVLVTLTLLGAPVAQAFPGGGSRAVRSLEAPDLFSTLQNLFARLLPAGAKNRASIDPNGATAPDENRAGIDPDGAVAPENENRIGIDPDGAVAPENENRIGIDPNG